MKKKFFLEDSIYVLQQKNENLEMMIFPSSETQFFGKFIHVFMNSIQYIGFVKEKKYKIFKNF